MTRSAVVLSAPNGLVVTVLPELGGNIASIVTVEGMELLAQDVRSRTPDDFASALGGYDDCFPAITGDDGGSSHGWLWSLPWKSIATTSSRVVLEVEDSAHGILATRVVDVDVDTVRVEFRVVNRGSSPLPFLWAGHLLLAVSDGDRLDLPPGPWSAEFEAGPPMSWPPAGGAWTEVPQRAYGKFYAPWPAGTAIGLIRRSVAVTISAERAPVLGVWVNRGYPPDAPVEHVGLEPTTAPGETIPGEAPVLAPGGEFVASWRLRATRIRE